MTRMQLVLAVVALGCVIPAAVQAEDRIEVRVLSHERPRSVEVSGARAVSVAVADGGLLVNGERVDAPYRLAAGVWRVQIGRDVPRTFHGDLAFYTDDDVVEIVASYALEDYVARVVASETVPGTPPEALRAQAVVARSFVLGTPNPGARHAHARVCDLAHCQVLRSEIPAAHLRAARAAARATAGQILVHVNGTPLPATFHRSCGGHTASAADVWGGDSDTVGVADTACRPEKWQATISRRVFADVAHKLFETPVHVETLEIDRDETGRALWVVDPTTRRKVAAEGFVRALDQRMGWGHVRSARMSWMVTPDGVRIEGNGVGHGVGMCQAGARARAERGDGYVRILEHYFPNARVSQPSSVARP